MRQHVGRHPPSVSVDTRHVRCDRKNEGPGDTAQQQTKSARGAPDMAQAVVYVPEGAVVRSLPL